MNVTYRASHVFAYPMPHRMDHTTTYSPVSHQPSPTTIPHMSTLLDTLAKWKPFSAVVIGDFMLDDLVYGDAERLSADAPVPILRVRRSECRPGGAANVVMALVAMKARVAAVGVVGDDREGGDLRRALEAAGVDCDGLVTDPSRPTTVKRSLIGLAQHRHPQKMFRLDYESCEPVADSVRARLLSALESALPSIDVVCIEDYAKGVCDEAMCRAVIDMARRACKPVFVDPASLDSYAKYRGAAAATPNRTEAERAAGLTTDDGASPAHNADLAREIMRQMDAEAVVLTLDRHGALLLERGGEPTALPTVARDVYDVTGAGDVFLAGLAAGRANGLSWEDAVRLANLAAGLEVEVFGVVPIPIERVHHQALLESGQAVAKLRTREQLLTDVASWRSQGRRIVFTNGCFDVLHAGHVWLLDQARRHGDVLIVAVNTDDQIREYKGPTRPVNTLHDRVRVLAALACVDAVVAFDESTPIALLEAIRPDVLAKGDEYSQAEIVGAGLVTSYGGKVVRIPMLKGQSTTDVLERMGDDRAKIATTKDVWDRFVRDQT